MKAEFIGHGLNNRLNTVHYYLRKSFLDSSYDTFIGFSAYTKKTGLDLISKEILVAKEKYKNLTFYLGIAERGTSKEALQFLLDNEIKTYTFWSGTSFIFHPKIFFFEGEFEKRMIIGSSNLTKSGLTINGNIEASVLLDYSRSDSSGLKLQRQYFEYFDEVINCKSELVKILTPESLEKFINDGVVVEEYLTFENENSKKKKREKVKRIKQKEESLEEKSKQPKKDTQGEKSKLSITLKYLETWEEMFVLFKDYKKNNNGSVTISRDYPDKALYRWYRLQKIFYADDSIDIEYDLKYEHVGKLIDENFFFGDAHELLQQNIEDEWLNILSDALSMSGEADKIQVNHRYKFNGYRLGTWLVGVSQATKGKNPKQRKIELRSKIEELGFDFLKTSRKPEHSATRFLEQLLNDKKPIKVEYQKLFNRQMLPRRNKIPENLKQEISAAWEIQFNELRSWEKITRDKDRTEEWKEFRYDNELNPEGKWITGESTMGKLYNWVYHKRKDKKKMNLVINKFSNEELNELRDEGFPV
ncbi:MAG: phospholipase D family protein [Salinivirgaceae bacterium]